MGVEQRHDFERQSLDGWLEWTIIMVAMAYNMFITNIMTVVKMQFQTLVYQFSFKVCNFKH